MSVLNRNYINKYSALVGNYVNLEHVYHYNYM
jgi:hypothetical protein